MAPSLESKLDPIFPLPAGTGLRPIKQGHGKDLFENDLHVAAGMTYRSFYVMWEQVEHLGAKNYEKYIDGPDNFRLVAETWLEAVTWCRQMAWTNIHIEPISERKARAIREKEALALKASKRSPKLNDLREGDKEAPSECPKCGPNRTILKKKHKGEKVWKCADCEHRWPRSPSEAPQKPSKALDKPVRSKAPGKNKPAKQRPAKKGVRGKKKAPV